jgi:hypothetical protein
MTNTTTTKPAPTLDTLRAALQAAMSRAGISAACTVEHHTDRSNSWADYTGYRVTVQGGAELLERASEWCERWLTARGQAPLFAPDGGVLLLNRWSLGD